MSESSLIEREIKVLQDLSRNAAERAAGEAKLTGELAARTAAIDAEHQTARKDIIARAQKTLRDLERVAEAEKAAIVKESQTQTAKIQAEYETVVKTFKQQYITEIAKSKKNFDETKWQSDAVRESGRESAKKAHELDQRAHANEVQARTLVETEANGLLDQYRKYIVQPTAAPEAVEQPAPPAGVDPRPDMQESIKTIDDHINAIYKLNTLKTLRIDTFIFLTVFLIGGMAALGWFQFGYPIGVIAGGVIGIGLVVGLRIWLTSMARKKMTAIAIPLRAELAKSIVLTDASAAFIAETFRKRNEEVDQRRENEIKKLEETTNKRVAWAETRRDTERKRAEELYPAQLTELARLSKESLKTAEDTSAAKIAETRAAFDDKLKKLDAEFEAKSKQHANIVAEQWNQVSGRWTSESTELKNEIASIHSENDRLFQDWRNGWASWNPPQVPPPVIRFGSVLILSLIHI